MDKLAEAAPKIITEASKTPLGVVSLMIMALSVLGYFFFVDSSEIVRISMFILMFIGFGLLSVSLLRGASSSRAIAMEKASLNSGEIENKEPVSATEPRAPSTVINNLDRSEVKFTYAIKRLNLLWLIASFVLFSTLFLQTIFGKYDEQVEAAWAWLLPTLLPTLSVLVASQATMTLTVTEFSTSVFAYRHSMALSAIYLVLSLSVVFLEPFVTLPTLTLLSTSNLWLAPLQGLVLAAIMLIFFSRNIER